MRDDPGRPARRKRRRDGREERVRVVRRRDAICREDNVVRGARLGGVEVARPAACEARVRGSAAVPDGPRRAGRTPPRRGRSASPRRRARADGSALRLRL